MAHVASFNALIKKSSTWTSVPYQTDFAEYISGQAFAEKAGKLKVEETYDLPPFPGNNTTTGVPKTLLEWAEEAHWSIATWAEDETALAAKKQIQAEFEVKAGETISFNAFAGAPYWRLSLEITGAEDSKANRVFARAFERGRV